MTDTPTENPCDCRYHLNERTAAALAQSERAFGYANEDNLLLERRVAELEAELDSLIKLRRLVIENGSIEVDTEPAHEMVVVMAAGLAKWLGDAPNYTETSFTCKPAGEIHGYVLTVRREEGETPHALRQKAEAARDAAEARIAAVRALCDKLERSGFYTAHVIKGDVIRDLRAALDTEGEQ